jgi:hypothetical protein
MFMVGQTEIQIDLLFVLASRPFVHCSMLLLTRYISACIATPVSYNDSKMMKT